MGSLAQTAIILEAKILKNKDFSLLDRYRGRYFLLLSATFALVAMLAFLLWRLSGGNFTTVSFTLWLILPVLISLPVLVLYLSQSIYLAYQAMLFGHFSLYSIAIAASGYYHSPMMVNLFYIPLIALLSGRAKVAVNWSATAVIAVIIFFLCAEFQLPNLLANELSVSSVLWYQWNLIICVVISGILALAYEKTVQVITDVLVKERQYFERDALTDSLTGLANAHQLERVTQSILQEQTALSFIAVDVDHFISINKQYGHHTGDQILQAVAKRLQQAVSRNDIVARLEADHFIILLPKVHEQEDIIAIRKSIEKQLALPVLSKKHELRLEFIIFTHHISQKDKQCLKFYKNAFVEHGAVTVMNTIESEQAHAK
jgi:diguanylate cyclase (GGDEF)-like protein